MKNDNLDFFWFYPILGLIFWYVVIHFLIKFW